MRLTLKRKSAFRRLQLQRPPRRQGTALNQRMFHEITALMYSRLRPLSMMRNAVGRCSLSMVLASWVVLLQLTTLPLRRVKVHAGPATPQYGCAALLDSGSPATFINSNAVGTLKAMGAISEACISHGNARSWGGFGKSESLETSDTVRLSVQFFHGDSPSASLAVWAHIVPANTRQYPHTFGTR